MKSMANRNRKLSLTIALIFLSMLYVCAQDIASSNLTWIVDQTTDVGSSTTINYSCEIKTFGSGSVKWIQKKGEKVTNYQVSGTEGTWTNIALNGSFTYLLVRENKTCSMKIEKGPGGTYITFDFSQPGNSSIQKFRVQSVN
jgi:hypothetical protein